MKFRNWLEEGIPAPVWKEKKPDKKKDRRKFMSKVVSAKDEDLDSLADEMKSKGYSFRKNNTHSLHKWLLERIERIRQCLRLLSEAEQNVSRPPRKWKNGGKE